jgi:hypothetical protein
VKAKLRLGAQAESRTGLAVDLAIGNEARHAIFSPFRGSSF